MLSETRVCSPEGVQPLGLHDLRHSAAGSHSRRSLSTKLPGCSATPTPRVTPSVCGGLSDGAAAAIGEKRANQASEPER